MTNWKEYRELTIHAWLERTRREHRHARAAALLRYVYQGMGRCTDGAVCERIRASCDKRGIKYEEIWGT